MSESNSNESSCSSTGTSKEEEDDTKSKVQSASSPTFSAKWAAPKSLSDRKFIDTFANSQIQTNSDPSRRRSSAISAADLPRFTSPARKRSGAKVLNRVNSVQLGYRRSTEIDDIEVTNTVASSARLKTLRTTTVIKSNKKLHNRLESIRGSQVDEWLVTTENKTRIYVPNSDEGVTKLATFVDDDVTKQAIDTTEKRIQIQRIRNSSCAPQLETTQHSSKRGSFIKGKTSSFKITNLKRWQSARNIGAELESEVDPLNKDANAKWLQNSIGINEDNLSKSINNNNSSNTSNNEKKRSIPTTPSQQNFNDDSEIQDGFLGAIEGFLKKRTLFNAWKQKFYVLTGGVDKSGVLCEFSAKDFGTMLISPNSCINLKVTTVTDASNMLGKPFCLALHRRNKPTIFLRAASAEEFSMWMKFMLRFCEIPKLVFALNELDANWVLSNEKGKILDVSKQAEDFFGYTKQEVVGKNVRIFMDEKVAEHHQYYMNRYLKTQQRNLIGKSRRVVTVLKDGTQVPVLLCLGEFYGNDAKRKFLANFCLDADVGDTDSATSESSQRSDQDETSDQPKKKISLDIAGKEFIHSLQIDTVAVVNENGNDSIKKNLSGCLAKKGIFGKWKEYWFCIENNGILVQYSLAKEMRRIRSIVLENCTVLNCTSIINAANTFCLSHRKKGTMFLRAPNAEEASAWIAAIASYSKIPKMEAALSTFDTIWIASTEKGKVFDISDKALQLFGYQKDEVIGQNVKLFMDDSVKKFHNSYMARYCKTHDRRLIGKPRRVIGIAKGGKVLRVLVCLGEFFANGKRRFLANFKMDDQPAKIKKISTSDHRDTFTVSMTSPLSSLGISDSSYRNKSSTVYNIGCDEINWSDEEDDTFGKSLNFSTSDDISSTSNADDGDESSSEDDANEEINWSDSE